MKLQEVEKDLLNNPHLGKSYGKNIYKLRISGEAREKGEVPDNQIRAGRD